MALLQNLTTSLRTNEMQVAVARAISMTTRWIQLIIQWARISFTSFRLISALLTRCHSTNAALITCPSLIVLARWITTKTACLFHRLILLKMLKNLLLLCSLIRVVTQRLDPLLGDPMIASKKSLIKSWMIKTMQYFGKDHC